MEQSTESTQVDINEVLTAVQLMAVLTAKNTALSLIGKYIKQILTRLEADGILSETDGRSAALIRKHIKDGLNDFGRELDQLINF